jgi:hypothetical protein
MLSWLVALVVGSAFAILQYRLGGARNQVRLQALRGVAVTASIAVLLNAPVGCSRSVRPYAALDASASWRVAGDSAVWRRAVEAADSIGADTTLLVGDSVRAGDPPDAPSDGASHVGPLVERALGAGRAVAFVTDGRVDDPERLQELPSGSSVILLEGATRRDAALASLSVPPAAVTGDSIDIGAVVAAGSGGTAGGRVELAIDGASIGMQAIDSMSPFAEREVRWRLGAGSQPGQRLVRVVVTVPGDVLPRNDTLYASLEIAAGASAVFASTAPDFDARYALDVLRGTLAVPTRGYYRVAPGQWRVDGSLAAVSEEEVKRNLSEAPIVVLHGDTAAFGPPRVYVRGSLALFAPPVARGDEYYPTSAPPSPLMSTFSTLPWDSLPPIEVGEAPRDVEWTALSAKRGRRLDERRVVVGTSTPRRTVVVSAAGLWRWRFRGGRTADTFVSLWGSVFDWLAGETVDLRGARPATPWVRVGEAVRWRRGGMKDSAATVIAKRRGGTTTDTIRLRFSGASTMTESAPLAAGVYTTRLAGVEGLLVVNESAEWVPRRPTVRAGAIGTGAAAGRAPTSRNAWWIYAIALAALCVEWVQRRKIGLR